MHLQDYSMIEWARANRAEDYGPILDGASGVASCVGTFGSPFLNATSMYEENGNANALIARAAEERAVRNFAYVSAHSYPLINRTLLREYYNGKMFAESIIRELEFSKRTILRPGFVFGTRSGIPLYLLGVPLAALLRLSPVRGLRDCLPTTLGDFLETPVSVDDVARCVALGAMGELDDSGVPLSGLDITRAARKGGSV